MCTNSLIGPDLRLRVIKMKILLFLSMVVASQALQKPKEQQLSNKVQQLIDFSNKKPVIRLNGEKFKQYLTQAPRNYSVIAMFTALRPERLGFITLNNNQLWLSDRKCSDCVFSFSGNARFANRQMMNFK